MENFLNDERWNLSRFSSDLVSYSNKPTTSDCPHLGEIVLLSLSEVERRHAELRRSDPLQRRSQFFIHTVWVHVNVQHQELPLTAAARCGQRPDVTSERENQSAVIPADLYTEANGK